MMVRRNRQSLWLLGNCGCWLCWWMIAPVAGHAADGQTLHTAEAIYADARLLKLEAPAEWRFGIADQTLAVDADRVIRWGTWPGIRNASAVWLSDGSWLCGTIRVNAPAEIMVDCDWLECPPIPLSAARGLIMVPPGSLSAWIDLQTQMLAVEGARDVVWLVGGRKLSGVIRWSAQPGSGETERFQLDAGGQVVELSLDDVQAIVFSPALLGRYAPQFQGKQIGFKDGSLLRIANIDVQANRVSLSLASGLTLKSYDDPQGLVQGVACLTNSSPGVVRLSQLEPANYRNLSDSTLTWDLGVNRDVLGRPLRVEGGLCFEGLAMHSSSQVAYRWDGSPARFLSQVEFASPPPQADPSLGSVACEILLARGGKLEKVQSFLLNRHPPVELAGPQLIDVDISGAQLVVLVTEKADFGQYGDHIFWLDARIAPAPR